MAELKGFPGMVPYPLIFPAAEEGVVNLLLPAKVGKAKAGQYSYVEAYCVDRGCDCRSTLVFVLNAKGKPAAVIKFGFDPDDPLAGPYLDEFNKQPAGAADLLEIFVEAINDNSDWIKGMHRRYKQVRKQVDGRAYRGKPFPKPGAVERFIKPPEDEIDPFETFASLLKAAAPTLALQGRAKKPRDRRQGGLFGGFGALETVDDFIDQIAGEQQFAGFGGSQSQLREFLSRQAGAAEELAMKLVEYYQRDEDERLDAALRLLRDIFEILRIDLERRRPDSLRRMEDWQAALARQVFAPGVSPELGAFVTHVLLDARVEILPLLHEANSARMFDSCDSDPDFSADPEQAMLDLLQELDQHGEGNPFMLFEALLQMMAVGDVEVQVTLCRLMLASSHPVVREAAVLMLFHPQAEVREGVAQLLGESEGRLLTPESLRRLIIARNWFPEALRGRIDQAIASARRARIECAPLAKRLKAVIYASAVDGAMAQTFQVLVPQGKGFLGCSIMPKKGFGVADAFLVPLAGKGERNEFIAMLRGEVGALESTADYLDRRICQALADGAEQGKVPSFWLVAIAEQLGRDQWKAVPFDPLAELAALRAELDGTRGKLLDESSVRQAQLASADWPEEQLFADSWFEDDVEVDTVVQQAQGKKRRLDAHRCLTAILERVLQPRRAQWLERLVLTTLWARSCKRPPVPWLQLYHVAAAVADEKIPLKELPLMIAIAENSLDAYLARQEEGDWR